MPKVPMRGSILLPAMLRLPRCAGALPMLAALVVSGCIASPPIVSAPSACSSLLPDEWAKGVDPAPLPAGDSVADWMVALDQQTGQLDKANDRYRAALHIVSACEARDAAAVKRSKPKVLGIF